MVVALSSCLWCKLMSISRSYCLRYQPQLLLADPQAEQADGPNSILELMLNPYPKKSTLTGLAFSKNSLSIINWNPFISCTSSVSLGSFRAIANEGPPHPPSFKNIRIGAISLPLKYSAICWLAASVTSIMVSSLRYNMISSIRSGENFLIGKVL